MTQIGPSIPERNARVTRIARRRALRGHEGAYEALIREMFGLMRQHEASSALSSYRPKFPVVSTKRSSGSAQRRRCTPGTLAARAIQFSSECVVSRKRSRSIGA